MAKNKVTYTIELDGNAVQKMGLLEDSMIDVGAEFDKVVKKSNSLSSKLFNMGNAFIGWGDRLVGGVADVGNAIYEAGSGFEKSMSKVQAVTGATDYEMTKLTGLAKEMGATTKFSASQASEALGFLGMAGFSTNEAMSALPSTLDLAAAGGIELGEAADIASNALSAYGMKANELNRVNDIIAKTATSSNTSITQFAEAFKYVGPVAKSSGLSIEEVSASIGLLGNSGIQGSQAGTTLRGAISRLLKPAKSAQEAMNRLGLQATDSGGNLRGMADIMGDLKNAGATTKDMMTIFGQEAGPGMLVLMNQGKTGIQSFTNKLIQADGTAKAMAFTMSNNLAGKVDGLKSRLEALGISLFDRVNPALKVGVDALTSMASFFNDNMSAVEALGVGLTIGATAYGAYTLATSGAMLATKIMTGAQWALNMALNANPVGLVVTGIAALGAGLYYAYQESEAFRDFIHGTWEVLKLFGSEVWQIIKGVGHLAAAFGSVELSSDSVAKAYNKPVAIRESNAYWAGEADKALTKENKSKANSLTDNSLLSALPTPPSTDTNTTQSQVDNEVKGSISGTKNININIGKFQDSLNINVKNLTEGAEEVKAKMGEAFLMLLNDSQTAID